MKDTYGEFCPTQQCPVMCLEIEFFCEGPEILLGCKDKDICVTRKTQKNGDPCPGVCPVKCDPEKEIKCDGQMEPTACITQEECHAKAKECKRCGTKLAHGEENHHAANCQNEAKCPDCTFVIQGEGDENATILRRHKARVHNNKPILTCKCCGER